MTKLGWGLVAAAVAVAACRFNRSGPAAHGDGSPVVELDARRSVDALPAPDASTSACPAPVTVAQSIDGITAPSRSGGAFEEVLVGDTVELSAAGSCVQHGPISYAWQISPIDGTRGTASPGLTSETLTLYPVLPQQYDVSLTVGDGAGRTVSREVFGFSAYGFAALPGAVASSEIRDIAIGDGRLWVASKDGPFYASTANFQDFIPLADTFSGDLVAGDVASVYVDPDSADVWYGAETPQSAVWRASLATSDVTRVDFGQTARVLDIGPAIPGVAVATDHGLFSTGDGTSFAPPFAPPHSDLRAVVVAGNREWTGGDRLYDAANAAGVALDPLAGAAGPDDRIRALAVTGDELWIGTDGHGVVRASATSGAAVALYSSANSGLPSDHIRGIAIEQGGRFAGDVWAATDAGIARFKRDRDVWVPLGSTVGLAMHTDVRAIAVGDRAGERAIYAGTNQGVVYISVP